MNFIQLITLLVERASLNEQEMKDAKELLGELEILNAFGFILGQTTIGHICIPRSTYDMTCSLCRKAIK